MNSSRLSAKYQIVIPQALRRRLGVRPGQRVYLTARTDDELVLRTTPDIDEYLGVLEPGGEDPVAYQKRVRADKTYQ